MKPALVLLFFIISTAGFSQSKQPSYNSPLNCLILLDDHPIKPLNVKGKYHGTLIVQATVDTALLTLTAHRVIYADLKAKSNLKNKIQLSPESSSGDVMYLEKLQPVLIKHLSYLKFRKSINKDCILSTVWKFPVRIM